MLSFMCSDKHHSSYPYSKQSLHLIKAIRDMCTGDTTTYSLFPPFHHSRGTIYNCVNKVTTKNIFKNLSLSIAAVMESWDV